MSRYNRPVPGTMEIPGREFLYIESPPQETYRQMSTLIRSTGEPTVLPTSGGAGEEGVWIHLKDGTSFMAVSYKGDIDAWRTRYLTFCERTARAYAFIKDNEFILSTGEKFPLGELEIDIQKP